MPPHPQHNATCSPHSLRLPSEERRIRLNSMIWVKHSVCRSCSGFLGAACCSVRKPKPSKGGNGAVSYHRHIEFKKKMQHVVPCVFKGAGTGLPHLPLGERRIDSKKKIPPRSCLSSLPSLNSNIYTVYILGHSHPNYGQKRWQILT